MSRRRRIATRGPNAREQRLKAEGTARVNAIHGVMHVMAAMAGRAKGPRMRGRRR